MSQRPVYLTLSPKEAELLDVFLELAYASTRRRRNARALREHIRQIGLELSVARGCSMAGSRWAEVRT